MTSVLVTGATGYIGSHLVRHLANNPDYKVAALVRPSSDTATIETIGDTVETYATAGDVSALTEVMRVFRPDVVVHLASLFLAEHGPNDVERLIDSNLKFGACLLEAMLQAGVKSFVNTGTSWETMDGPPDYRPVCLYAATKRAFEDILRYYEDAHAFKCMTVKLYDTYGPEDPRPKLFALLNRSLTAPQPIPFSPGEQLLDLLHVDDVVDAYERAIGYVHRKTGNTPESIYIGSGVGIRLKDIVAVFEGIAGVKANIEWGQRPYRAREVMVAQADSEAALRILGWQPRTDLTTGIQNSFFGDKP